MLSFIVCSFFFFFFFGIFYILYKKKKAFILCLVVDSKPWGFYQSFIVPVYAFSVVFAFLPRGKIHIHCQTSLLDIDWNMYSAHAFVSLMYTNWLISNQKQSSNLYTWSAFVSQSVCAGASGFIVVVNSFVVGLFLFFEPVTICHSLERKKKSARYGIIVNMKGCVKGPASFWRLHLKTRQIFFSFFWLLLCRTSLMTHNQVEMQRADRPHIAECWVYMLYFYMPPFYWLDSSSFA